MLAGLLALTIAALFTGAALYVNIAEQPARLMLEDRALLAQWKPSYKRGFAMQAPLAVVACLLGLLAWWLTGRAAFVIGALLMIANWPFTLLVIMPVNSVLMDTEPAAADSASRALIEKWSRLHAVRTGLGAVAVVAFLMGLA